MTDRRPHHTTDAVVWAREFTKACHWVPLSVDVRDVVIGWFAGAIEAGREENAEELQNEAGMLSHCIAQRDALRELVRALQRERSLPSTPNAMDWLHAAARCRELGVDL